MRSEEEKILDEIGKKDVQEQAKKAYATPQLTVHGNVEKITRGGRGGRGGQYGREDRPPVSPRV